MSNVSLQARAAFTPTASQTPGLVLTPRDNLGLATVIARKGSNLQQQLSVTLPTGPSRVSTGELAFAGIGPGTWLASHERGPKALAAALNPVLLNLASVADQSDAYAVLRLSGTRVRDTLVKLIPIDVHPNALKIGAVASTTAGHMGTLLWRLEDASDSTPVFEIAVYRSYSEYFWRMVEHSTYL